ncbi:hypothetical protein ACLMAJ_25970 [Nocardia sp. KC 131]|uniref:hypothetical protein n=1 Tax=Nocardia arseniciresistens TaxID=3392119 RepID=UPI00398EC34C
MAAHDGDTGARNFLLVQPEARPGAGARKKDAEWQYARRLAGRAARGFVDAAGEWQEPQPHGFPVGNTGQIGTGPRAPHRRWQQLRRLARLLLLYTSFVLGAVLGGVLSLMVAGWAMLITATAVCLVVTCYTYLHLHLHRHGPPVVE